MRLFNTLLTFAGFCIFASVPDVTLAAPTPITLDIGEIALEGIVRELDLQKMELRLEASKFFLPNGKTGEINPPKFKVVHLETTGATPNSLGDQLRIGQKIVVSGRDLGTGKSLNATSFQLLEFPEKVELKPLPPSENRVPIQPGSPNPIAKPSFPIEGKDGGFTFRILDAKITSSNIDPRPTLLAKYTSFSNDAGKETPVPDWGKNLKVRLLSPQGLQLDANIWTGGLTSNRLANYEWVWMEFAGRDPKAPDGLTIEQANGFWEDDLTLDIPVPTPDKVMPVNKTLTAHGSVLQIDDVKFVPQGEGGDVFVRIKASAQQGGYVEVANGSVVHPTKEFINTGSALWSESGASTWMYKLTIKRVPPGETWKLKFTLRQTARSRAVSSHRFKLRLKVPLKALPSEIIKVEPSKPQSKTGFDLIVGTVSAQNADVKVDVETTSPAFDTLMVGNMIMRDLSAGNRRVWNYKSSKAWDEKGTELRVDSHDPLRPLQSESDGSPAGPNIGTRRFQIIFDPKERPQKVKLHLDIEGRETFEYNWSITTPIPPVGETLYSDVETYTERGIPFVLREVRRYNSVDDLSGFSFKERLPTRGVALIFEAQPMNQKADFNMGKTDVIDEFGRPLVQDLQRGAQWYKGDALAKKGSSPFAWTLLLSNPPANLNTVEIQSKAIETGQVPSSASLDFENVVIPVKNW